MLPEEDMRNIQEMCDIASELNSIKSYFKAYVETRMNVIAPNLCTVLESSTAAKIMGNQFQFYT